MAPPTVPMMHRPLAVPRPLRVAVNLATLEGQCCSLSSQYEQVGDVLTTSSESESPTGSASGEATFEMEHARAPIDCGCISKGESQSAVA